MDRDRAVQHPRSQQKRKATTHHYRQRKRYTVFSSKNGHPSSSSSAKGDNRVTSAPSGIKRDSDSSSIDSCTYCRAGYSSNHGISRRLPLSEDINFVKSQKRNYEAGFNMVENHLSQMQYPTGYYIPPVASRQRSPRMFNVSFHSKGRNTGRAASGGLTSSRLYSNARITVPQTSGSVRGLHLPRPVPNQKAKDRACRGSGLLTQQSRPARKIMYGSPRENNEKKGNVGKQKRNNVHCPASAA